MKNAGNGKSKSYRIDMSEQVAQQFHQIKQQSKERGIEKEARAAVQVILRRLRAAPLEFGELFRTLKFMKLVMHAAVVHPVTVQFAVHEETRTVYIRKIRLL